MTVLSALLPGSSEFLLLEILASTMIILPLTRTDILFIYLQASLEAKTCFFSPFITISKTNTGFKVMQENYCLQPYERPAAVA